METSQEGLAKKNKNNKFRQNELLPNAHTVHMRGSVCLVYYQKCEFNFQLVVHSTKSQCQVKECVEFVIFVFLFKWLLCIYIQIARPSLFPPLLFHSTDIHRGKSSNNQHRLPYPSLEGEQVKNYDGNFANAKETNCCSIYFFDCDLMQLFDMNP